MVTREANNAVRHGAQITTLRADSGIEARLVAVERWATYFHAWKEHGFPEIVGQVLAEEVHEGGLRVESHATDELQKAIAGLSERLSAPTAGFRWRPWLAPSVPARRRAMFLLMATIHLLLLSMSNLLDVPPPPPVS